MKAAKPDFVICDGEAENVIDEGFGLASAFGHTENVGQKFADEDQVWGGTEVGREGEDGTGAAETVSGEV